MPPPEKNFLYLVAESPVRAALLLLYKKPRTAVVWVRAILILFNFHKLIIYLISEWIIMV